MLHFPGWNERMSTSQSSAGERPVCPNCGLVNRIGALICERCSTNLIGLTPGTTALLTSSSQDDSSPKAGTAILGDSAPLPVEQEMQDESAIQAGSDVFDDNMVLRLEVMNSTDELVVDPRHETVIGRRDPATGMAPDIDLTSFSGYKLGVSRKHAVLRVRSKHLEILDLGSSNGTLVNGVHIFPHEPRLLRDGDQLLMGKLIMRVHFQIKEEQ
ncbi:MAG: hypothetical protein CUN53_08320 [Phototrophicales bacterium]|nr:MAG: hypothetical protein CUN53_08320 [Phototrophicales bacterium]